MNTISCCPSDLPTLCSNCFDGCDEQLQFIPKRQCEDLCDLFPQRQNDTMSVDASEAMHCCLLDDFIERGCSATVWQVCGIVAIERQSSDDTSPSHTAELGKFIRTQNVCDELLTNRVRSVLTVFEGSTERQRLCVKGNFIYTYIHLLNPNLHAKQSACRPFQFLNTLARNDVCQRNSSIIWL